jgi:hypothetical protein
MYAIDHDVEMTMGPIKVGYEDRLVFGQPEAVKHTVGDPLHHGAVDQIGAVSAEQDMIHRLFRPGVLTGRVAHDNRGHLRVVR